MEAVWIKHKLGLAVDAGNTPHHILNIAANLKKLTLNIERNERLFTMVFEPKIQSLHSW